MFGCNFSVLQKFIQKLAFVKDSFNILTFIYKSDNGERAKYEGCKFWIYVGIQNLYHDHELIKI